MSRGRGRVGRPWRRVRAEVLAQSDVCWLCGYPGADTVDHVVPLSLGGDPLSLDNLRPAHKRCNSRRGNRAALRAPKRAFEW